MKNKTEIKEYIFKKIEGKLKNENINPEFEIFYLKLFQSTPYEFDVNKPSVTEDFYQLLDLVEDILLDKSKSYHVKSLQKILIDKKLPKFSLIHFNPSDNPHQILKDFSTHHTFFEKYIKLFHIEKKSDSFEDNLAFLSQFFNIIELKNKTFSIDPQSRFINLANFDNIPHFQKKVALDLEEISHKMYKKEMKMEDIFEYVQLLSNKDCLNFIMQFPFVLVEQKYSDMAQIKLKNYFTDYFKTDNFDNVKNVLEFFGNQSLINSYLSENNQKKKENLLSKLLQEYKFESFFEIEKLDTNKEMNHFIDGLRNASSFLQEKFTQESDVKKYFLPVHFSYLFKNNQTYSNKDMVLFREKINYLSNRAKSSYSYFHTSIPADSKLVKILFQKEMLEKQDFYPEFFNFIFSSEIQEVGASHILKEHKNYQLLKEFLLDSFDKIDYSAFSNFICNYSLPIKEKINLILNLHDSSHQKYLLEQSNIFSALEIEQLKNTTYFSDYRQYLFNKIDDKTINYSELHNLSLIFCHSSLEQKNEIFLKLKDKHTITIEKKFALSVNNPEHLLVISNPQIIIQQKTSQFNLGVRAKKKIDEFLFFAHHHLNRDIFIDMLNNCYSSYKIPEVFNVFITQDKYRRNEKALLQDYNFCLSLIKESKNDPLISKIPDSVYTQKSFIKEIIYLKDIFQLNMTYLPDPLKKIIDSLPAENRLDSFKNFIELSDIINNIDKSPDLLRKKPKI